MHNPQKEDGSLSGNHLINITQHSCPCSCYAQFELLLHQITAAPLLQTNNAYPAGTYPAAQPAQPAPYQTNQYPQANPNQAYPQNTGGYNPAPYNAGGGHPNIATGTPANEYNGVQMSALPHEKPGYQTNV